MRQDNELRQKLPPATENAVERFAPCMRQVMADGVATDEQRQLDPRELPADSWMPQRRTFRARRQVAASGAARIAKSDWHHGDACLVIERIPPDPHPISQSLAALVVEGKPRLVCAYARRLTDDEELGRGSAANDRPWFKRQVCPAKRASADLLEELCKIALRVHAPSLRQLVARPRAGGRVDLPPPDHYKKSGIRRVPLFGGGVAEWLKAAVC